ncbi:MAG TPA: alanine--tRNA ligase, partial [Candidatus Dormibacteraeota bacterium]|nr:alanine--tRNA ligase [Candidatus Dormibacteraeota bacterium]
GDYFKKDAIAYAWELITSPNWYGIPVDKLYFTVFGGHENLQPDHDAAKLWIQTGAPKDRVIGIPGLKENFWAMGDTGPCGPCSEIHYDMGVGAVDTPRSPECTAGNCKFPCDCGRYVEIWNLVFMQFNRDASGKLNPLPKPSVDTGMGLERVAAVLQNKISNFDTDLFTPLMDKAAELCHADRHKPENQPSLRIIADHSRAATFLISDGVIPSNEDRGYVLRKIIRRGLRHARMLNAPFPFMSTMSATVRKEMKDAYPELEQASKRIAQVLDEEDKRFTRTVDIGLKKLEEALHGGFIKVSERQEQFIKEHHGQGVGYGISKPMLDGASAFKFYDTYGLPRDFIEDVARDSGFEVAWAGFDKAMAEQQQRSKASWKGAHKEAASPVYRKLADTFTTEPDFYFGTTTKDCHIEAIVTVGPNGGERVNELKAGQEGEIVLDRTTIYSESGGQISDTGGLYDNDMSLQVAEVRGAYYPVAGLIAHRIVAKEDLEVGDRVATVADAARRARIMRNHTGTHLMNAALRNILGMHVKQAGSLNAPDHLRFDFSHFAAVGAEELLEIEQQVNEEILRDLPLHTDIMNIDDALAS